MRTCRRRWKKEVFSVKRRTGKLLWNSRVPFNQKNLFKLNLNELHRVFLCLLYSVISRQGSGIFSNFKLTLKSSTNRDLVFMWWRAVGRLKRCRGRGSVVNRGMCSKNLNTRRNNTATRLHVFISAAQWGSMFVRAERKEPSCQFSFQTHKKRETRFFNPSRFNPACQVAEWKSSAYLVFRLQRIAKIREIVFVGGASVGNSHSDLCVCYHAGLLACLLWRVNNNQIHADVEERLPQVLPTAKSCCWSLRLNSAAVTFVCLTFDLCCQVKILKKKET